MNKNTLILLPAVIFILAGCGRTSPATPLPDSTAEANVLEDAPITAASTRPLPSRTPTAALVAGVGVTRIPRFDLVTGTPTPPTPTPDPVSYGVGETFQVYVSYTFEPGTTDATALGAGIKHVVVVATLANQSEQPVVSTHFH